MCKSYVGLVENYSYLNCPDCKKKISVFGESHAKETALKLGIPHYATLPIQPDFAKMCDQGKINEVDTSFMDELIKNIIREEE